MELPSLDQLVASGDSVLLSVYPANQQLVLETSSVLDQTFWHCGWRLGASPGKFMVSGCLSITWATTEARCISQFLRGCKMVIFGITINSLFMSGDTYSKRNFSYWCLVTLRYSLHSKGRIAAGLFPFLY